MKIGVVADDLTGANKIGSLFARHGCITHIYTHTHFPQQYTAALQNDLPPEVVIIDIQSRSDAPHVQYEKIFNVTQSLHALGCPQFLNCTQVFDAMVDALETDFALVLSAQPALMETLHTQTNRAIGVLAPHEIQQLDKMREKVSYVVIDIADENELKQIAHAVKGVSVLCGDSIIVEALLTVWDKPDNTNQTFDLAYPDGLGILCAIGSAAPQTVAQVAYMRERGTSIYELHPLRLFDAAESDAEIQRLSDTLVMEIRHGRDVVLHSANSPQAVEAARMKGELFGLTPAEVSLLIAEGIAEIVARVVRRSGQNRLLVVGNETLSMVSTRLGIYGMRVWKEIQPGLPSCISLTHPPLLIVLKSGSEGTPDFIESAIEHLKEQRTVHI